MALSRLLLITLLGGASGAATSPFADWSRSLEGLEGEAIAARVTAAPLLARAWLSGHLDMVAKGDARAVAVATALGADPAVASLIALDAVALDRAAGRIRGVVVALARGEPAIEALGRVRSVAEAHAVCYGVLFNAWQARAKYAGWGDTTRQLGAARRVAALLVVVDDDLTPWRAMAAWVGEPVVPDAKLSGLARMEARGMNALLIGQPDIARRHFVAASYAGVREPLAPVWMLAAASAYELTGHPDSASRYRRKALAAVKHGPMWLRAALRKRASAPLPQARTAVD
jgi:hypothetical protein